MAWLEGNLIMKLSDYVAEKVAQMGIGHVFMVTGGGAMHLNLSLGTHPELSCTFNHHEQASAMAAEAYYRVNNSLALVNVTSGPGGTNAITGVFGAFVDSIGMVVLSGQVKWETTVKSTGLPLRQYGDQELDIVELVRPVTKYATMITNPDTIRYELEKAFHLAKSGRPGPCWLDIPLNVQIAQINPDQLKGFDPDELAETCRATNLNELCEEVLRKINAAKRPVILVGSGIRLSGQHQNFLQLVEKLQIPVVTGWNAHDAIWNEHPLYAGRPGTIGDRGGNFVTQNADLLLILGSRLNIRQVSYNWNSFARHAFKIWVDIDKLELNKPSVKADLPIHADLRDFFGTILKKTSEAPTPAHKEWLAYAKEVNQRYPVVEDSYRNSHPINPYYFMERLFKVLDNDQIIVTGNGSACVISFQAAFLKPGQRLWTNSGCASMGYDLPAAIGASRASDAKPVICITGDGSIMMNLQELQTIMAEKMPIKVIILNNNGYLSITQTHRNFFNGVEVGGSPRSGVSFPDFSKISEAFNIPYRRCEDQTKLSPTLEWFMANDGPLIYEIMIDENQPFAPKLSAKQLANGKIISPPLEDLSPFLDREELKANMMIPLQEE